MEKIKIVTDTASDITLEQAQELDIELLSFMLSADGNSYRELVDLSIDEFYALLEKSDELPTTSQITAFAFEEMFEKYYGQGYTDVIYVSINAKGSATYQNACMAKNNFYESHPEAADKMRIHIIDSRSYTAMYGYPVREAAKKAATGTSADELVAYLEYWAENVGVYFLPMTLKYVKKSGRVSAAAAFAGDLLGLRPLIRIADGETSIAEKVRGEKNIVPKMVERILSVIQPEAPYIILHGCNTALADSIAEVLTERLGYPPVDKVKIGAAIAINAGPDLAAVVTLEKK
jgi:DegV family protein with EDD domain